MGASGSVESPLSLETIGVWWHQFTQLWDLPARLQKQNGNNWTDSNLELSWAERQGWVKELKVLEVICGGRKQSLEQGDKPGANGMVKGLVGLQNRWNEHRSGWAGEVGGCIREPVRKSTEVMLVQPPICCSNFFIHRFNVPSVMGQPVVSLEALVQMLLM